ncbi:MAG: hypothetical protein JWN99_1978 [Ilumatobacteraceae bacterium]|nr:hypothetical protein [Ilumatobacteraceae bacterium]
MAYIGAVLVLGLTACGSPSSSTSSSGTAAAASPPVIRIDGSSGGGAIGAAAPMAADTDAASSESTKMMAGPITYVYDGDITDLTAPAAAWYFDPTVSPTTDQIATLAHLLGIDGDVRTLSADMGSGWIVGPDDYSQPTLNVGTDAMQSWWYSPGNTAVASTPPCELYPPGDPAGDFGDTSVGGGSSGSDGATAPDASTAPGDLTSTDTPVCVEPTPPANVPDKDTAESKARDLFTSLGLDPASYQYETYADEWGANVTAYLTLDGIRTNMTVSVGFGAEGALTWASGYLGTPQRGADYPRIGIDAAIKRLNDQTSSWMSAAGPVAREASSGMATDAATDMAAGSAEAPAGTSATTPAAQPAVAPATDVAQAPEAPGTPTPVVGTGEGVCLDDAATDCAPIDPITVDPITITLSNARPSLEQLWASDDTVWLLPGYAFDSTDGGVYSVMAVEDKYIEVTEPKEVTTPDTALPVVDPGQDPAAPLDTTAIATSPADCPPTPTVTPDTPVSVEIGSVIVGLCQADAAATLSGMSATLRVVRIDGVDQAVTADHSESRVNVAIDNGFVTEVVSIG